MIKSCSAWKETSADAMAWLASVRICFLLITFYSIKCLPSDVCDPFEIVGDIKEQELTGKLIK